MFYDYLVILVYCLLMVAVGWSFKDSSQDISDYFRAGCRGTWWLVGASCFMQGFSAITFTGISGQAYIAGWSVMIIFWSNALGFFLQAAVFAPWFRQTRAITGGDVIYARFGRPTEQFYIYLGILASLLWSAVMLLGLSTFISTVFGLPLWGVIVFVGAVVGFYSVASGQWGVMATDFLQAVILIPMTVLVAVLCLRAVGGVSGLVEGIAAQNLAADFALIKPAEHSYSSLAQVAAGSFTWGWLCAMALNAALGSVNLNASYKYLAVKDGREARRAAALAGMLMLVGSCLWFIPPMTARLLWADQVRAVQGVGNIADAAYAVASLQVLPRGLVGMLVVTMLAATMSTMDTGLTNTAGAITRNAYPPICRALGWRPLEGAALLRLGQVFNLLLGVAIVLLTLWLSVRGDGKGLFETMLDLMAMFGAPMTMPMVLGLFIRRTPSWAALASCATGFLLSLGLFFHIDVHWFGGAWTWQQKLVWINLAAAGGFVASMPGWRWSSSAYRTQVAAFFQQMFTPVDFRAEVGAVADFHQLRVIGRYALLMGALILLLLLIPNPVSGRVTIAALAGAMLVLGAGMTWRSRPRRTTAEPENQELAVSLPQAADE